MRELIFDLSADSYLPKSGFAGFEGEHCATDLTLILPERLQEPCAEFYMVFEILKTKETVFSAPIVLQNGSIHLELPKQLMLSPGVSVYGAAYRREKGELVQIAKTGRVSLEIKDPENENIKEYSSEGGFFPGLVIENEIVPGSGNPVSSDALDKKFTQLTKGEIASAWVNEKGELVLKKNGGATVNAGSVGLTDKEISLFSQAIKGKKTGEVLSLDDVSSLEHEVKIKVTADLNTYEPDYDSGPIFELDNLANMGDWINGGEEEGFYTVKSVSGKVVTFENGSYMEDMTASMEECFFVGQTVYFDGGMSVYATKEVSFLPEDIRVTVTGEDPSEPKIYIPGANGVVEGVKSSYPEMTISCNIEGAILEAEYHRDINKVIENLDDEVKTKIQNLEKDMGSLDRKIEGVDKKIESESKKALSEASREFANVIKNKVNGEYIRLDDVSPFEHEIGVKLSGGKKLTKLSDELGCEVNESGYYTIVSVSDTELLIDGNNMIYGFGNLNGYIDTIKVGDTVYIETDGSGSGSALYLVEDITDYSDVVFTEQVNNIIDIQNPSYMLNAVYEVDRAGVATITRGNLATGASQTYASRVYWNFGNYDDFVGKSFAVSFEVVEKTNNKSDLIRVFADQGKTTSASVETLGVSTTGKKTIYCTIPENTGGWTTIGLYFYCQSLGDTTETGQYMKFKDLQVQIGDTVIEPKYYTPNKDGTVEGIIGKGECITLMTDTEGVNIEAEYCADTKKYIDKKFLELASMIVSE